MLSLHLSAFVFLCLSALALMGYLLGRERRATWRVLAYAVFLGFLLLGEGADLYYWPARVQHSEIPFTFVTVESLFQFVFGVMVLALLVYEVRVSRESRMKQEKNQQLQESLEEKDVLLNEIHHRVKNNLQVIVSLLGLQKRQAENPEVKQILERCQNRILSMSMVHRKIYDTDWFSEMDLSEYVPDLTQHLIDAQSSADTEITAKFDLVSCPLDLDRLVPFGMVLAELITNALEHAFEGRDRGTIEVYGQLEEDGILRLSVRDDGVGWTPVGPLRETNSLGLKLLDNLVRKQLRGGIEFEQNNGSTVHLSIPFEPTYGA